MSLKDFHMLMLSCSRRPHLSLASAVGVLAAAFVQGQFSLDLHPGAMASKQCRSALGKEGVKRESPCFGRIYEDGKRTQII